MYLKLSWENGKPYCIKVWDHFPDINESDCKSGKYINNCYVPTECGREPGRVFTDPNCKPELKPLPPPPPPPDDEPPPTPYAERDSDGDGIKNSQDACPNERGPRSNAGRF